MKHLRYETVEIPLSKLVLHPKNVRAKSKESYGEAQVAQLAANIAAHGLLQPLLVTQLEGEGQYGVLAGGRRLAALKLLSEDETVAAIEGESPIICRLLPEGVGEEVSLSLSENILQMPMDALDRYEAFAAMRDQDGLDVAQIAQRFGIAERRVKEALRLGNIHADIRAAHRKGELSLEALTAFEAHPDPKVQLEAYEALAAPREDGSRPPVGEWAVKRYFRERYVRVGDALGQFILEAYKAEGGAIAQDLIEEDSVLTDSPLIEKCLTQVLSDMAEERRAELGFAWSEHRTDLDWSEFQSYGRVYPEPVDLDEAEQAGVQELATRLDDLAARIEQEDVEDIAELEGLEAEHRALEEQIEALTHRYSPWSLLVGGVIAIWQQGKVRLLEGMVRPEDMPDSTEGSASDGDSTATDGTIAPADGPAPWSAKLSQDMAYIRTRAIGLGLAQSPELARAYAEFCLIRSVFATGSACYANTGSTIEMRSTGRSDGPQAGCDDADVATEVEGRDLSSLEAIEGGYQALLGTLKADIFQADDLGQQFEAYRSLSPSDQAGLLAYAVSQSLKADARGSGGAIREIIDAEALPDIREYWQPDAAFLARLTKPALLDILIHDLDMAEQAASMGSQKKSEIVAYLASLFAEPFATLTEAQRQAVIAWAPPQMRTVDINAADGA